MPSSAARAATSSHEAKAQAKFRQRLVKLLDSCRETHLKYLAIQADKKAEISKIAVKERNYKQSMQKLKRHLKANLSLWINRPFLRSDLENGGGDDLSATNISAVTGPEVTMSAYHVALSKPDVPLDVIELLHKYWPQGVSVVDSIGQLPLHYACQNVNTHSSYPIIHMLIQCFPRSILHRDSSHASGLSGGICTERFVGKEELNSTSIIEEGSGRLPIHYLGRQYCIRQMHQDITAEAPVHRGNEEDGNTVASSTVAFSDTSVGSSFPDSFHVSNTSAVSIASNSVSTESSESNLGDVFDDIAYTLLSMQMKYREGFYLDGRDDSVSILHPFGSMIRFILMGNKYVARSNSAKDLLTPVSKKMLSTVRTLSLRRVHMSLDTWQSVFVPYITQNHKKGYRPRLAHLELYRVHMWKSIAVNNHQLRFSGQVEADDYLIPVLSTVLEHNAGQLETLVIQDCQLTTCQPVIDFLKGSQQAQDDAEARSAAQVSLREIALQGNRELPSDEVRELVRCCPTSSSIRLALGAHHADTWTESYFVQTLGLYGAHNNVTTMYRLLQARRDIWLEGFQQRREQRLREKQQREAQAEEDMDRRRRLKIKQVRFDESSILYKELRESSSRSTASTSSVSSTESSRSDSSVSVTSIVQTMATEGDRVTPGQPYNIYIPQIKKKSLVSKFFGSKGLFRGNGTDTVVY